jgi:predicted phosphoadenosine phosphosulfate sulfurtransferase
MKYYLNKNVYESAIERINWLFDEFENIIVNVSGGKDSTVVYNLSLNIARERNRLPLNVLFIDQEAEWDATIEQIRKIMYNPEVRPIWLQMPIRIFNATSPFEPWLHCWEPGAKWIREKDPISIKENVFGTDRFKKLFPNILNYYFPKQKACFIAGVRCEESPGRMKGLTNDPCYKHVTWGAIQNKKYEQITFYPVYDWSYTDVWKAIHDNGWDYCRIYDYMYQYGIATQNMRVSNVHHETAVRSLMYLQELEPETWERITGRMNGVNTVNILNSDFYMPKELPYMFKSWEEYRDYLLENLIIDEDVRKIFRNQFKLLDGRYIPEVQRMLVKTEISMLLVNDYESTKLESFQAAHGLDTIKYRKERGLNLTGKLPKDYVHNRTKD